MKERLSMTGEKAYEQLCKKYGEITTLRNVSWGLHWDQDVMMPTMGLKNRARQLEMLSGLEHEMLVVDEIGDLLSICEDEWGEQIGSLGGEAKVVNVREIRREYDLARKLPGDLVKAQTSASSLARGAWGEAKKDRDFKGFSGHLEKLLGILREKADCLSEGKVVAEKWDALADLYEPGCQAREVEAVFRPLRERLVDLVGRIAEKGYEPKDVVNGVEVGFDAQMSFVRKIAEKIGFDFEGGRLDTSAHPFCSGYGYGDVRMTTHVTGDRLGGTLSSVMHESGHGMYTQGALEKHAGMPMGNYVSLGIHESQSRMWENQVGRSETFWKWCAGEMRHEFGELYEGLNARQAYEGMNGVKRSLIRTRADEVTYNLHVMVRFELEVAMMRGDLEVADLPGAWDEKYKDYLGLDVPDVGVGCLQDIHWSLGAIGYFPTYTLGNLYSAQFYEAAKRALGDIEGGFEQGEFVGLLGWLQTNIHEQGMRYRAGDLCEEVTGEKLGADALMRHLEAKFGDIYGL
ncbi:Thermostable carboxypeptidase 1 [Poriferisphaera corsica]|uniref:Metal-dependent carboxypeptidase n=1 Tax=Poriferisphaera corsica TaxID=2528020 RepID=A0A517YVE4_9BACT|nr:carboxypeptidase M32 [Poriferisphaera corsica]QDU34189.1 Thermostable carboxypeptidase 1 [Poriferisphaera corsica]